ncbi:MAG TPA: YcbK family protein [Candidatus Binataceae bacterium]|nr:YcbK family protein [Candidatus Binataceae bacterium]
MSDERVQDGGGAVISRRRMLRIGALAAAQMAIPGAAIARILAPAPSRKLQFYNLHTGESLRAVYWENGRYVSEELDRINFILRDFRANEVKPIDRRLLDLLVTLQHRLGSSESYQVISGYRSPLTNAMLHSRSEGVAVHSLHIDGRAIDIRVPGRSLSQLHGAALAMHAGGVGYYPRSNFVHVDTGRPRWWNGA